MLEFQESFFKQEIRNGFYIDVAMKTLWAAELEVLQKVAEVCDRHGIVWYAAYGTLLGAIRHEGFVPWDDDMDIWVKRKDYNRLIQILPQELPQGYLVRCSLGEEKFDQYHTCVNSGDGISIGPEWLKQYHGCPFTVGLDIFPLDYLPRDEAARAMQEGMFAALMNCALLANYLCSLEGEDATDEKRAATKEEILDGISYLEENCGVKINRQLIEDEDWEHAVPEIWRWANYVAMMYGEEESDYLVPYMDYVRYHTCQLPKEWFAETYGATFENFVLPIPCGYEPLLRRIYGAYRVIRRRTGSHEYPYYARQLRWLRERVRADVIKAGELGIVDAGAILSLDEDMDLLPEWNERVTRTDGRRKKIVMMANDADTFCTYGAAVLEKLRDVFRTFEKAQEQVTLWWRPSKQMEERLKAVSLHLAEQYQEILRLYKEGNWGICDETDNIDRAVEWCDVYYGDMNAILQPFQNAGKAVMMMGNEREWQSEDGAGDGYREASNRDRQLEYRTFLSLSDYVEENGKLYFSNTNYNGLAIVDKATWTVERLIPFEGEERVARNLHLRCVKSVGKICFLPAQAQCVHIYDMGNGTQSTHSIINQDMKPEAQGVWDYFVYGDQVYLLPGCASQKLHLWDARNNSVQKEQWWNISLEDTLLGHGSMDEKSFYSYGKITNRLYITDLQERVTEEFYLPDEHIQYVTYDGNNFWYLTMVDVTNIVCGEIVCWNREQGEVERYPIQGDIQWECDIVCSGIHYEEGNLFLLFYSKYPICTLCVLDTTGRTLKRIHSLVCSRGEFGIDEMETNFKKKDGRLAVLLKNAGEMVNVDLKTLECEQRVEEFPMDIQKQHQVYPFLLDKGALLYEVPGTVDLHTLIQHYSQI